MANAPQIDPTRVASLGERLRTNVGRAVKAADEVVKDVLVALLSEGHVLVEDHPGVGKTALARAFARSIAGGYSRIQGTADLLPADVVGTSIFNQQEGRFEFRPGPVFANLVLFDEINRASPKTQSGLLECMQERRVTVDVHTHELARPFLVIATQNPVDYEGTYPLPEAQLDRFMVRVSLGYPPPDEEAEMLADHGAGDRVLDLGPVCDLAEVLAAQATVARVHASAALRRYVVALLERTRADERVELGASPRAGLMLLRAAKAAAALAGRDHALPDDVQALARAVLGHRLLLRPEAVVDEADAVVRDAIERVPASLSTSVGRALATGLLGALLLVAATGFGAAALLLPGSALALLALGSATWTALAGRGSLERKLGSTRVIEGEACPLTLEARLLLPAPAGSELVEPQAPDGAQPVGWGRNHRLDTEARFDRRGRWALEPARLVVRDPLRLAAREVRSSGVQEVLVLPRVEPVRALRAGRAHGPQLVRPSDRMSEEGPRVDFDTLREARPEVPASRIHWPAVARTGTLVERSLLAQSDHRPLLVLDAERPSSPEDLDSAVRAAASLCFALARAGGCDLLLPGERRSSYLDPGLAGWPALHARLALVEEGGRVVPLSAARAGAVFWITAESGAFERGSPPRALSRAGGFVVAPGPATRSSAFAVAGCQGRRLGRGSRRAA